MRVKTVAGLVLTLGVAQSSAALAQQGGDAGFGGWMQPADFRDPVDSDRAYAAAVVERLRPERWGGLKSLRAPARPSRRAAAKPRPAFRGVYFHMALGTRSVTVARLRTHTISGSAYALEDFFQGTSTAIANSFFVGERRGNDVVFVSVASRDGASVGADAIHSYLLAAWKGKSAPAQGGGLTVSRFGPGANGGDLGTRIQWATFTQLAEGATYTAPALILKHCRFLATVEAIPDGPAKGEWEKLVTGPTWDRFRRATRSFLGAGQNDLRYELEGTLGRVRVSTGSMLSVGSRTAAGRGEAWAHVLELLEHRGTPSVAETTTVEIQLAKKKEEAGR